jgi:predicted transposase YbfD/YdcC
LLRTLTCSLVSSAAKMCLDAYPIPAHTNEMGAFPNAFRGLCRVYGRKLFALVSTDAGMSSLENADLVVGYDKHYLFGCKQDQPTLLAEAQRLLARKRKPLAETVDLRGNLEVHRRLYLTQEMAGFLNWRHLQTVVRVESEVRQVETGLVESKESRYYLSSLPANRLSPQQWLLVVRNHWGVENQGHWTLDAVFEEDDRPWIRMSPKGALVVMLLRRMAYNLLALYRI